MAGPDKEEEAEAAPAPKAAPRWRKFVLIGVGVLLVMGIGIGATLLLMKTEVAPAPAAAGTRHGETGAKAGADHAAPRESKGKPLYLAIDPAFVVNLQDHGSLRFLQIGVEVMTHQRQVIDALNLNMPQVRDRLVMLFSGQSYESVSTRQGKERLRKEALAQIRRVMQKEIGEPGADAVYFTSFVMQ
ncbi:MAG TPA: flagellar basal body protein FliL [Chromatiales bacterium]|nr:flagellar basal body protein FliL [Chromatiales bacterium]